MFQYPATLKREDGGFVVTFKDIPEAITQGETEAEALSAAKDALETALDFYFEDNRAVPLPSKPKPRQHVVELPASLSAKILLLNEMIQQHVRPAELARRLEDHTAGGQPPHQRPAHLPHRRHRRRPKGAGQAARYAHGVIARQRPAPARSCPCRQMMCGRWIETGEWYRISVTTDLTQETAQMQSQKNRYGTGT